MTNEPRANHAFVDCLPTLLVSEGRELQRRLGPPQDKLIRLECPISGRPCVTSCTFFGSKRHGNDGPYIFVCWSAGKPIPLGVPDEGFDVPTLLAFSFAVASGGKQ